MDSNIQKTILDNGLTVISEYLPSVRSVSVGAWIKVGSRYEDRYTNGIAHFLEHMVFKGTKKRSAFKIAQSLEELGGNLNAYTSKELTVFYTHTLDSHLSISVNVLADLICNPLFRERDIETEKQVVAEEIAAVKDTPDEYIIDVFQEKLFPDDPLGMPILGTETSLENLTREQLNNFWRRFYCPDNIILSAAGNVNHRRLVHLAERFFHFENHCSPFRFSTPKATRRVNLELVEAVNQSHICAGLESISYLSEERYPLIALNLYLGGGMSSRLFQVIREKYGLAYTVYSFTDFFRDTGILSFYLGTDRKKQKQAEDVLFTEIEKLRNKPIRESTVRKIREQLKGSFLLGLESSYRRMTRLAKNEIFYRRQLDLDEMVRQVDRINSASMLEMARKIFIMDRFNIIRLNPHV